MNVWDQVDRLFAKSKKEFEGTKNALEALGFHHLSVSEYGVWRAKHKDTGWVTASTGPGLLLKAKTELGQPARSER